MHMTQLHTSHHMYSIISLFNVCHNFSMYCEQYGRLSSEYARMHLLNPYIITVTSTHTHSEVCHDVHRDLPVVLQACNLYAQVAL